MVLSGQMRSGPTRRSFPGPLEGAKAIVLRRDRCLSAGRLLYAVSAAREAGSAAEAAAARKSAKYTEMVTNHIFQPIAIESLGPINASGCTFLKNLRRKLSSQSGNDREASFLFQRISVLIQRFNAVLLHDSFVKEEE